MFLYSIIIGTSSESMDIIFKNPVTLQLNLNLRIRIFCIQTCIIIVRSLKGIIMPTKYKYLDNGLGILLIGEGILTGEDIIHSNREIFASTERMKKYKYGLIDWLDVTQVNISTSEIEIMVSQNEKASEYVSDVVVAVAAKNDLAFGLSRMWEIIVETTGLQWETMVFKDRDSVENWIKHKIKEKYNIDLSG